MKKQVKLFLLLLFYTLGIFAQSKKEQIANLSIRLDSMLQILSLEKTAHKEEKLILNKKIIALEEQIRLNKPIQVGAQNWMAENLNVSTFRNGDVILQAQSDEEWQEAGFNKQAAWCYYNDRIEDSDIEVKTYGKLYNSFAINDPRGLAPEGWRLPSEADWKILKEGLLNSGMSLTDAFSKDGWTNGYAGTNSTGLNFYPAGWRDVGCGGLGSQMSYWAYQSPIGESTPYVSLFFDENGLGTIVNQSTSWIMGFNVRCIRE